MGSLSGKVVNSKTNEGIEGAEVLLRFAGTTATRSTKTNSKGEYEFKTLAKNEYTAKASAKGYRSATTFTRVTNDTKLNFRLIPILEKGLPVIGVKGPIKQSTETLINTFTPYLEKNQLLITKTAENTQKSLAEQIAPVQEQINEKFGFSGEKLEDGINYLQRETTNLVDRTKTDLSYQIGSTQSNLLKQSNANATFVGNIVTNEASNTKQWTQAEFEKLVKEVGYIQAAQIVGAQQMGETVGGAIDGIVNWIGEQIANAFKIVINWFLGVLQTVAQTIWGFVDWAMTSLANLIYPTVRNFIRRLTGALQLGSPQQDIEESMNELTSTYMTRVTGLIEKSLASAYDITRAKGDAEQTAAIVLGLAGTGIALGMAADVIHPLKKFGMLEAATTVFGYMGIRALAAPIVTVPYNEGVRTALTQHYRQAYRLTLPAPAALSKMLHYDLLTQDQFTDYVSRQGYDDVFMDGFKAASYNIPDTRTLFELYWRNIISEADLKTWLKRSGVHPDIIDNQLELTKLIPPAPDLIQMVVREAFKELAPERMRVYWEDAPAIFAENMLKKGFSQDWSNRYWMAHWLPMPLTAAREAVHRGFITMEDYDFLLRIADFHPMWREPLKKIVYRTWRLRDMRIGWELGKLDDEALKRRLLDYGYPPDDVEPIMDVMKSYALQAEISAVRNEMIKDYVDGFIDEATLRSDLTEIGTPDMVADYYVRKAVRMYNRNRSNELIKVYTKALEKDKIPELEFKGKLQEIGISTDRIQNFIDVSTAKKKYA